MDHAAFALSATYLGSHVHLLAAQSQHAPERKLDTHRRVFQMQMIWTSIPQFNHFPLEALSSQLRFGPQDPRIQK